jgi:hypothetical protein
MHLDRAQLEQFHEQGFLVVRDCVPLERLDELRADIEAAVDLRARDLAARGESSDLCEDLDWLRRATALYRQCPRILRPVTDGALASPGVFHLLTCPEILDGMEQLVGPEVVASSVYRIRPKLPEWAQGEVPWHQDCGYVDSCSDGHLIVTCWVPLMDATVEAGCMEVLPGSHKQGVYRHYWADVPAPPLTVHPDHLPDIEPVAVPAAPGDAVLMTGTTCHRSIANRSGLIRWAIDLRYNAPEAGDYFAYEAGFLARSRARPDDVLRDADAFVRMRVEHTPRGKVDRLARWLPQARETFSRPPGTRPG